MGRLSVGLYNVETGHLALKGAGYVGIRPILEDFSGYIFHRAHKLRLLQSTVTDYDSLLKYLTVNG